MSDKRDFDRVRSETLAWKKGTLNHHQDGWLPAMELSSAGPQNTQLQERMMYYDYDWRHYIWVCQSQRCGPYSTFEEFLRLNQCTESEEIRKLYASVQAQVMEEFVQVLRSTALSNREYRPANLLVEFPTFAHGRLKQTKQKPKAIPEKCLP